MFYTVDLHLNGVNDGVANQISIPLQELGAVNAMGSSVQATLRIIRLELLNYFTRLVPRDYCPCDVINTLSIVLRMLLLLLKGEESYDNMWQKVRAMWAYATNYITEFDYFHIIGDDGYVHVDNLRKYLNSREVRRLENGYLDEIARHKYFIQSASQWIGVRPR